MGNSLSSSVNLVVDTSPDVFAPEDQLNDIILGVIWACCVYIIIAIWCFFTLLGRWVEENSDSSRIGLGTVTSRFILSLVWPLTLGYLFVVDVLLADNRQQSSYDRKMPV